MIGDITKVVTRFLGRMSTSCQPGMSQTASRVNARFVGRKPIPTLLACFQPGTWNDGARLTSSLETETVT